KLSATRRPGAGPRERSLPAANPSVELSPARGPALATCGVRLGPVVRVDTPWTPSRTSRATSRKARRSQRAGGRAKRRVRPSGTEGYPFFGGGGGGGGGGSWCLSWPGLVPFSPFAFAFPFAGG